jgi:hypothetical protein
MDFNELISTLKVYPLSFICFTPYLQWLGQQPNPDLKDNDLIAALSEHDSSKLEALESLLVSSRQILGLSEKRFVSAFGFLNDLLTSDPEKVHDILSEPIIVVNLSEHGFDSIKKLPRFIKYQGTKIPAADFLARSSGKKYAIEVKTVRMDNPRPVPGQPTGNAIKPYWWGNMFRNNLITKIEDKDRRVIAQLVNTKQHFACDYTMLVLYNRRIGPSVLMDSSDYLQEIRDIKPRYPDIDYIIVMDYYGRIVDTRN